MSWEWLDTWLSVYGDVVDQIVIIVVYDQENNLIGAIPLYLKKAKQALPAGGQFCLIGSGEDEWEEVASEYLDLLSVPGLEQTVCDLLLQELDRLGFTWNQLVVENVLDNSILLRNFIPLAVERNYNLIKKNTGLRYRVKLPESWGDYETQLGKSMRRKLRQSRKRIHEIENQKTEVIADFGPGLDTLKKLHEQRWEEKDERGAFASQKFIAFHREFMQKLVGKGVLRLRRTNIDNNPIAILYNIRFGDTESYYQSGFDLRGGSRIRPGIYAHMNAIEESIEEKARYYDMMKGGNVSYKSEYAAEVMPMLTLHLYNRSLSGKVRYLVDTARNYARNLRDRIIVQEA